MGVRLRVLTCAACVLAAVGAAGAASAPAPAAWAEDNTCGYLPGVIFPLPVTAVEAETPWTAPEARFTYDSPSDKPPAVAELSASATWGDGTSTPVPVELATIDCYRVVGPSHVYAHPGSYAFSFAIHDASAGLGHQLAPRQVQVWNPIPQLLWSAPPHLYPTVGRTWTGVVGEFGVESPWNANFYGAQVEREPGAAEPATIAGGHERLVVTASLRYTHPFNGTLKVLLTRLVGKALGSWATATVTARALAHIGIHGRPALVAISGGRDELVLRLSRTLPRRGGRPAASVYAAGQAVPLFHFGARHANRCYAAVLAAGTLANALTGGRLPFTLAIRGHGVTQREGVAAVGTAPVDAVGRRLGC